MEHEYRASEKIRFRREEIADLGSLPSAAEPALPGPARSAPRRRRRVLRGVGYCVGAIAALVLAVFVLLLTYGLPDFGLDRLRQQAERSASRFAGVPISASLGRLGISFDSASLIALDVSDVAMTAPTDDGPQVSAGQVRFGLQLLPLLEGRVQVGTASLVDARVVVAAPAEDGQRDWAAPLKNDDGLIEPDLVVRAVFEGLHRAFNGLAAGQTRQLDLENVDIVLPGLRKTTTLSVQSASLTRDDDSLAIAGTVEVNGRTIVLSGNVDRGPGEDGLIKAVNVSVTSDPVSIDNPVIDDGVAQLDPSLGRLAVTLAGSEGDGTEPGIVTADASMTDAAIDMGRSGIIAGSAKLALELREGSGKLEIRDATIDTGQSRLVANGALGPRPRIAGGQPSYRFELISNGSQLAAEGIQEPSLPVTAKIAGFFAPMAHRLVADDISISTDTGQVTGKLAVQFDGRRAPGIDAIVNIDAIPVGYAKQLWPFIVAPGGRHWVLTHVFGGTLRESQINVAIPPGRMGDGIPFTAQEVNGRFVIADTRFDILDTLPPVRDADGIVEFGGNNVSISLSRGAAYLASGGKVSTTSGTFTIPGEHEGDPVGHLDLDLSGEAKAVAELAAMKPLDAMRYTGLQPEELSGEIWGNARADIALGDNVDRSKLGWNVELAFDKLALAKPFSGQRVTEGAGTASIDRNRAIISGKAQLNGIPADVELVEPIGDEALKRSRKVTLKLDDAARKKAFSALDPLISGPIELKVDASDGNDQKATASLDRAEISLPWIGWSKGSGVPANLSFDLSSEAETTRLSNFRLSGDSFTIAGDIRLDGGGLASARFGSVKLNRGDEASVSVDRSGKSYAITARGKSFDARSLVQHYLAQTGGSSSDGGGTSTPVTIDAEMDRAIGFFNEAVTNLSASYSSGSGALKLSAVTGTGGAVALQVGDDGGAKSVRMQSTDAGSVLRFVNLYEYMQGGRIELALAGQGNSPLVGTIDARDFRIVNEPKLRSLVSSAPAQGQSLNQTLRQQIDTTSVSFERGFSQIEKGTGSLRLASGIVRGPTIGASFQGTVYDPNGNMDLTGTFLPAYGVNRIFGEIPLIGQILGNGRDRGLIGITFRLAGNAKKPELQINPISIIAPGIFRSIFEF